MMLMTYGAEQRAAGEYTGLVKQIRKWMKKGKRTAEDAADDMDISVAALENVVSVIKANPDWDDEDVADEVDWML